MIVLYNSQMKTSNLLYLKGLLAPFCSKRYHTLLQYATACKSKKSEEIKVHILHAVPPLPFGNLLKGLK